MVSFGQGCEGEPLTRAREIAEAIRGMRAETPRGSININTNGSLPENLALLIDAGLDACRISLNSAHAPLYEAVLPADRVRLGRGGGVDPARPAARPVPAVNLLTFPGVTDQEGEAEKLCELVARTRVDQVQARSLAIDPDPYLALAERYAAGGPRIGLAGLLRRLKRARKGLVIGNFARGLDERRPA